MCIYSCLCWHELSPLMCHVREQYMCNAVMFVEYSWNLLCFACPSHTKALNMIFNIIESHLFSLDSNFLIYAAQQARPSMNRFRSGLIFDLYKC